MLVGLGLDPGPGELYERRRFSSRPELHGQDPCYGAITESAVRQVAESSHDAVVLLCIPAVIQAVQRSWSYGRRVLPYDLRRDAGRWTCLAGRQVTPDASQHHGLSVTVLRWL